MRPIILGLSLTAARRSTSSSENQQSTNTTPSRPPRQPLSQRDGNVRMMPSQQKGRPLSTRNANGSTMPSSYDKQALNNNASTSRPIVPTLTSAAAKTVNKTPLTPRVAGPAQSPMATPVPRRPARLDGGATPAASKHVEDISSPVSNFLGHNITPRSSSRKTRVDSANTTPITTPSGTPAPEPLRLSNDALIYGAGLGIEGLQATSPKRSTVTFGPALSDMGNSRRDQSGNDEKFFYASDAKIAAQQPRQQKPLFQSKSPNFFYANGESIPPPVSSGASAVGSVTGSSMGEERSQAKFFHVNGTPDLKPELRSKPSHTFSTTGSVVSNASHMTTPRLGTRSPQQRPTSPPKVDKLIALAERSFPSLKTGLRSSPVPHRPNNVGRGQSAQEISPVSRVGPEPFRRASGHEKSASVGSLDLSRPLRRVSIVSPLAPASPKSPPQLITTALAQSPEPIQSDNETGSGSHSAIQSPVKAGQTLEQMNELAANARRERKVLDLEITNSSLAAINRTLEREMRKQTAELRRYRRLSRSGRLSIATSNSRKSSLAMIDEDGNPLSDMSEDSEEDDDEEDETSEDESVDDASLSPSAMAESDARHRKKDEKRLQLDLSKHQQLLIDSQKMNQSLKRCLGWTEELINEGKKALAYHVRASDVELGGRVLAPDEVEEGDDNEGLSAVGASILSQARAHAAATGGWGSFERETQELELETGRRLSLHADMLSILQEVPP